jgi:hypothetical protein
MYVAIILNAVDSADRSDARLEANENPILLLGEDCLTDAKKTLGLRWLNETARKENRQNENREKPWNLHMTSLPPLPQGTTPPSRLLGQKSSSNLPTLSASFMELLMVTRGIPVPVVEVY